MADESPDPKNSEPFEVPEQPPAAERSLELPAVIIGDRGEKDAPPPVRLLPGRVPKSVVLYPAYTLVAIALLIAGHFALTTGEWNFLVTLIAWGLLMAWYWVYGVSFQYRRRIMKLFSLLMSTATAATLTFVASLRATPLAVPTDGVLLTRDPIPALALVAILTSLSLLLVFSHLLYFGRSYREKRDHGTTETP